MTQKNSNIVIKHTDFDLILKCDQLDRNLYKVIKLLNDGDTFYTHSCAPKQEKKKKKPPVKIGRPRIKGPAEVPQRKEFEYQLNNFKAFNMIWRSAYLTKHLGVQPQQLINLSKNPLVGNENKLGSIIQSLAKKVKLFEENQDDEDKLEHLKKQLKKLENIKEKISSIWNSLNYQKPQQQRTFFTPPLTLFNEDMFDQEKKRIFKCMNSYLLSLDLKMLQQSIMFIQELQTGHAIVTLEQCYPSFKTFKTLFKVIVGQKFYHQGLRQLMLAKEECYKRGLIFKVQRFRMCHECHTIKFVEQSDEKSYQCHLPNKRDSPTDFSYGYQQIHLMSNFSFLNDYEEKKTEITEMTAEAKKFLTRSFETYRHPFTQVYNEDCSRFYCQKCHQNLSSKEKLPQNAEDLQKGRYQVYSEAITEKLKKFENCPFCRLACKCERCTSIGIFNRMLAVYQATGGDFHELLSKLLFLNLESQQLFVQYVTFEDDNQYDQLEKTTKGVTLTVQQQETLPLPDQISKLQNQMSLNGFILKDDEEDSNKIYPEVQKIFNALLQQETIPEDCSIKGGK